MDTTGHLHKGPVVGPVATHAAPAVPVAPHAAHEHAAPVATHAGGDGPLDDYFSNATSTLTKLTAPEGVKRGDTIHPTELRDAVGLLFLSWKKGGLGISGITGHGALIKMTGTSASNNGAPGSAGMGAATAMQPPGGQGSWSAPVFVKMFGASVGLSAGFESGESIIVLRTPESVDSFLKNPGMIDLDFASVAGSQRSMGADKPSVIGGGGGPVSQYTIASGAMLDLSMSGVKFSVDTARNHQVYGQDMTASQIASSASPPAAAHGLLSAVSAAHQKAVAYRAPVV